MENIENIEELEPQKKGKKKHKVLKTIGIILGVLLLLLLIAVAAAFIYINSMLNQLDRTEITGDPSLPEEVVYEEPTVDMTDSVEHISEAVEDFSHAQTIDPLESANIDNILLIGSDRRSTGENGRSDAMILVTLNYDTGKIHLTSFMRAMYVCIPRSDGEVWGMLNAAYSWGGPNLLVKTIENNFRIDIDNYAVVDFTGFKKIIDSLGGVEVDLSTGEANYLYWKLYKNYPTGRVLLDGEAALVYSRIRLIDNDFVRTSRQREVIESLIAKARGADLGTLLDTINMLLPLVNTDLTNSQIMVYAAQALPMINNPVTQRMLPIENEAGKTYTGRIYVNGREMYKVDFEGNIEALHEFMLS